MVGGYFLVPHVPHDILHEMEDATSEAGAEDFGKHAPHGTLKVPSEEPRIKQRALR
jgi:hypothetical protein